MFFVDVDLLTGGLGEGFIRSEGREELCCDHGVPFILWIFETAQSLQTNDGGWEELTWPDAIAFDRRLHRHRLTYPGSNLIRYLNRIMILSMLEIALII